VSLSRTRFRVARGSTAIASKKKAGRGTVLRLASSEAGKLTIQIERARKGRLAGKGRKRTCKVTRKHVRHGRCTVFKKTATLTRTIKSGRVTVSLTGRIGKRRMAAGTYRLTLTVTDGAANVSKPSRRNFTIISG
jgi:hypothetical protein